MALATEAWPASSAPRVIVRDGRLDGGVLWLRSPRLSLLPVSAGAACPGCIAPAVVAFVVRRALDEPEIFVQNHAAKNENSFRALVRTARTFRTTLELLLCAVQNSPYYGLMVWLPPAICRRPSIQLTSPAYDGVRFGNGVRIWVCGQLADRIGASPLPPVPVSELVMFPVFAH